MFAYSSIWAAEDLGHPGRPRQGRLVQGALRRQLPRHRPRRLRVLRRRLRRRLRGGVRRLGALLQPERRAGGEDAVGAGQLQDLRLLRRPQALDQRPEAGRVRSATVLMINT